jgi:hypothetical protein
MHYLGDEEGSRMYAVIQRSSVVTLLQVRSVVR